jgi:glycine/betaine/sarcosine/D-proline reductase family selenoprotein B
LDRIGIPVAQISAMPVLALGAGANRVVKGVRIEHICGDPVLSPEADARLMTRIVEAALRALQTPVTGPTLFEPAPEQEGSHVQA